MKFIENEIYFSNIYIIQSLDTSEKQTGQLLFEDIFRPLMYKPQNWTCEFLDLKSKKDLINFLLNLAEEIETQYISPHLHLESHGEKNGLFLASGECLSWDELSVYLLKINIATKNNLFLSIATCYGGFIQHQLKFMSKPCPFRAFIGPKEKIYENDVLTSFTAFFEKLLKDKSYDSALQAITLESPEIEFHYIRAEQLFDYTIEKSSLIKKNNITQMKIIEELRGVYLHYNV